MSAELLRGLAEELRERIDWNRDVRAADLVRRAEEAPSHLSGADKLPELPSAQIVGVSGLGVVFHGYTADQMRAYAEEAVQPPQDERGQPVADRSAEAMKVKQRLMKMAREVGGLTWADRMCIGQAIALIDAAMGTPQQAEQGKDGTA